jgi:hypothetical protein
MYEKNPLHSFSGEENKESFMAEILETAMLVCFGLSWPISVVKNIRSKSARNMSLRFILLIVAGYVAGITAKIITGKFNYVLAVYAVNLFIVSLNIPVYFMNKKNDVKSACVKKAAA